MAKILRVKLPDPIRGVNGQEIAEIGIKEPRGSAWATLEAMGNLHTPGRNLSLVMDIAEVLSCDPVLTPPQVRDPDTGLSMADLKAIDEAISPFFSPGEADIGAAE